MPQPLYPREKDPQCPFVRFGDHRPGLNMTAKRKPLPLPGFEQAVARSCANWAIPAPSFRCPYYFEKPVHSPVPVFTSVELAPCYSMQCCYVVSDALRRERRAGGEVGELPMKSNKQACSVAVTTREAVVLVVCSLCYKCSPRNTSPDIMEIFSCVSRSPVATCLLLFTVVTTVIAATDGSSEKNSASESTSSDTTEKLKTEILYTPEVCTTKSKDGDMLTMHYKGTLQDGTTFDSR